MIAQVREVPFRLSLGARFAIAAAHRRRLGSVCFIGVTGSSGKTTTKELIAAALGQGTTTPGNNNLMATVANTVLKTRPSDGFCVAEVAAWEPGSVGRIAGLLKPHVAVVLNVGKEHRGAFRTLEATAREKRALVSAVTGGGFAVLNADDPHVISMRDGFAGRVITFGCSPEADLRAEAISASWPDRLSFTLRHGERSLRVQTRLFGKQWVSGVLAALGVALAVGTSLESAIQRASSVEAYPGRMSLMVRDGVTFVRDDWKTSWWSIGIALEFLAEARAERKVAVIGTIRNASRSTSDIYRALAWRAKAVADEVVFVGPHARHALKANLVRRDAVRAFPTVQEAAQHLQATLQPGDLVLLKGSNRQDHLVRVVLSLDGDVQCWRAACDKTAFCDECELLHVPAEG